MRLFMKYMMAIALAMLVVADRAPAFEHLAGLATSEHELSDLAKALNLVMSTATPELYFHKREIMGLREGKDQQSARC